MFKHELLEENKVGKVLTLKYTDTEVYKKGNDDITTDMLKSVSKYSKAYVEEAAKFSTEVAQQSMLKDKEIEKVIVELPFTVDANGSLDITTYRSKTYPSMTGGEPVTKSAVRITAHDPSNGMSKKKIKALEEQLTAVLLKD